MSSETGRSSPVRRVAIIAPDALSLLRQRAELIDEILARRHHVLALVPEAAGGAIAALNARGLAAATYPMPAAAPQLLADGKTVKAITSMLVDWRAHVALAYGAKSLLLGAVAAKKAVVPRRLGIVTTLPGLMLTNDVAAPSWGFRRLMRRGFTALDAIVLHNATHAARLQALGLVHKAMSTSVVSGAGVDLVSHTAQPIPHTHGDAADALNFVLIARMDAAKGVLEYCAAAKRVRRQAPETRFLLAGPPGDLDPGAVRAYSDCVDYIGDQADVRPLLRAAHVVVVPSWGEAMPRVLLEALASGRPVIASDIAGCREAVDERVNGVLVPPRDVKALTAAMLSFVARPDLNAAMARASRSKAERRFDIRIVNRTILELLELG